MTGIQLFDRYNRYNQIPRRNQKRRSVSKQLKEDEESRGYGVKISNESLANSYDLPPFNPQPYRRPHTLA